MLSKKCKIFDEYLSDSFASKDEIIEKINIEELSTFILLSFSKSRSKRKLYNAAIALYIFTNSFKTNLLVKNVSGITLRNISTIAWLLMHKEYDESGTLIWFICLYSISRFVKDLSKARVALFNPNAIHFMRVLLLPLLHNLNKDMPFNKVKNTNLKLTALNIKIKMLSHAGVNLLLKKLPYAWRNSCFASLAILLI